MLISDEFPGTKLDLHSAYQDRTVHLIQKATFSSQWIGNWSEMCVCVCVRAHSKTGLVWVVVFRLKQDY